MKNCFLFLTLLALAISGCEKEKNDGPNQGNDVFVAIESDPNLSLFAAALESTGLRQQLSGTFTVLAPTDTAFRQLFSDFNVTTIEQLKSRIGDAELKNVLAYHFIRGKSIKLGEFQQQFEKTEAKNSKGSKLSLHIGLQDSLVNINGMSARISEGNISAGNGIVHKIDKVLTLPTIASLLLLDQRLTVMHQTLIKSGLNTFYYQENERVTLFAPSDSAFQVLFESQTDFEDFPGFHQFYGQQGLEEIVKYQTLDGAFTPETFESQPYPTLLNGKPIFVSVSNNGFLLSDNGGNDEARLTGAHLSAINGEVLITDGVLLPD